MQIQTQTVNITGVSVIIPNYNGRQLLEQTLPPLFDALLCSGYKFEVIISDDCSKDDSISWLKANYPQIIIVQNDINKGFSPTINKGIFASRFDHLLLLNSDVKLTEPYFQGLARYFEREDTFGVMGRIIGWEDDIIQDGGKYPGFHGAKIKTSGNYIPLEPHDDDWLYSMYLSGANALVSKKAIADLGGFDELFAPFYVEDYELSLRAWRQGYKCYYDHHAVCRHKVSVSIRTKNSKSHINSIYYRNKMFLHAMHLEGTNLFLWYLQLIPETLIRIFTFRFYYLNSLKMFFGARKRMKMSMEKIRKQSKDNILSVGEVAEMIRKYLSDKHIRRF